MKYVSGHWLSFTKSLFLESEACKYATVEEVNFQELILCGNDDSDVCKGVAFWKVKPLDRQLIKGRSV